MSILILFGFSVFFYYCVHVIPPFYSVFHTSPLLTLISIKLTASTRQNVLSAQHSATFHRLWNHCAATTQIFNNLLQAPIIQIWFKYQTLWLKVRSL